MKYGSLSTTAGVRSYGFSKASKTKRLPAKTLVDAHNVLAESWGFEPQIGFGPILA
mgnify:CR=1 FL=1